jgi:hypothetical protein
MPVYSARDAGEYVGHVVDAARPRANEFLQAAKEALASQCPPCPPPPPCVCAAAPTTAAATTEALISTVPEYLSNIIDNLKLLIVLAGVIWLVAAALRFIFSKRVGIVD